MATLNPPKSISKRHELRQDKVVTVYARAWEFFDQNRMTVYLILGGILVIILGLFGYGYMQSQKGLEAQERLGNILNVYDSGELQTALDGTEVHAGLFAIADEYGNTAAGNLAQFYAADALFRLGNFDQALEYFGNFSKDDNLIGASAYAGEAAIYEIKEDFARAGDLYRRAAVVFENELTSPEYLIAAGRNYEAAGSNDEAHDAYSVVKEKYAESQEAREIDIHLARVTARR